MPHARRPSRHRIFVSCVTMTIAWGTFAFGAVYAWAYSPLVAACAMVGIAGVTIGRRAISGRLDPWLFGGLAGILTIGALQLCPLPEWMLATISPAAHRFLGAYNLAYASGVGAAPLQIQGDLSGPWHPLTVDPTATERALALFAGFVLFLAGLLLAFSRVSVVRLAKGLVLVGALLALVGILQKAMLGDQAWDGMKIYGFWQPRYLLTTPFGPYVNKNHYAGWMLMMIPVAIGLVIGLWERHAPLLPPGFRNRILWLSTPDGGRLVLMTFAVMLMIVALLMTQSRSGLACLFITLLLTTAMVKRGAGLRAAITGVGLSTLLVLGAAAWAGGDALASTFGPRSDSMQLRLDIWNDALSIVKASPLAGTGLNTFGTAMILFQTTDPTLHFQEAHNDYLQLLVEGGLLLAIPVLVTILALARAVFRRFQETPDDPALYWVRVGAAFGLIAIGLQSLVEFSLQLPGNAAAFTLLVAIALHRPARERATARHESAPRAKGVEAYA